MSFCDVYFSDIAEYRGEEVYPAERLAEICAAMSQKVRAEKYSVWFLLKYALKKSFGADFNKIPFQKLPNGKWVAEGYFFSLSHTDGAASVAVADSPVGVDIERADRLDKKNVRELCALWKKMGASGDCPADPRAVIRRWTELESAYKLCGDFMGGTPTSVKSRIFSVQNEGRGAYICLCNKCAQEARLFAVDLNSCKKI